MSCKALRIGITFECEGCERFVTEWTYRPDDDVWLERAPAPDNRIVMTGLECPRCGKMNMIEVANKNTSNE